MIGLSELATEAYVYGYPLVADLEMVDACKHKGFGTLPPTPFNRFAHSTELAGPDAHFVSVNNDTLYSVAQLDLSAGPVRLHVPDTGGAYYVLQFVDAWTNNFAYVGKRATGTVEGEWLIVPPGWSGSEPDDVRGVIDAPTTIVSVIGRNVCDGPHDLARVRELQKGFTLHAGDTPGELPAPDPDVPEQLRFFEQLRVWMADFPPSAPDQEYQDRFQSLGLLEEGRSPFVSAGSDLIRALTEGIAAGRARVETASRTSGSREPGAWLMDPHLFDYNLDHFGVGTLDSSLWRAPDRTASYLWRAVAARVGLWGNHGYEAVYAHTFTDSDNARLTGAHSYTLRFPEPPPVGAFWSLTMYDAPDYYLVDNPLARYSLGDRTPGLVHDDDGALTIVIQKDRPSLPPEAANWLPAPDGEFRPMIRLYMPHDSILQGDYRLPPLERRL
ncbi:DUF1254 domain-containing protein [Streptomyces purpureus]|uniref:DUF1254 domain-containing protein n=1 Tax=Streptomyces purpureus TaxID=1951 RepID=A0A918H0S4_9ACTN|nr:DUF1254 domain-containing protein [Streptomyces purpureus]GGT26977.1 hypothetical protein GCM10014713_20380 [Streptomyces purpureus]